MLQIHVSRADLGVSHIDAKSSSLLSFLYNQKAMGFALTLSQQADADDSYIL